MQQAVLRPYVLRQRHAWLILIGVARKGARAPGGCRTAGASPRVRILRKFALLSVRAYNILLLHAVCIQVH